MVSVLLWAAIALAVLDWYAVGTDNRRLEYFAKPAVIIALLIWMGLKTGYQASVVWFALGLFFSLLGDILLMLPREQFIAGLLAFLIAQGAYILGFNPSPAPLNFASGILVLLVALVAQQVYQRLAASLRASGRARLILPVLAYTIVISVMLASALITLVRMDWPVLSALLCSFGALLFFLSDILLAWNKFISPSPRSRVPSIAAYHLGQILIALGAVIFFGGL